MPPLTDFIVPHGKNAWQKHGQDQYALKNYTKALEAFTKAIQLGQGDLAGILDNRAATYCALGNLDSALNDARRMIKSDKKDPRGYLRTAKVLQLMKRFDEALRIYDYGLKTLDPANPGSQKIRELKIKLDGAVNGPKLKDPFMVLPREIVAEILRYLDLKVLLRLLRVSKLWLNLAVSFAKGWSHFDLSIAKKNVSPAEIKAYLRRFHSVVTHVTLANVKEHKLPDIVTRLSRCPKLTHCEAKQLQLDMRTLFVPFHSLAKLTSLVLRPDFQMSVQQLLVILRRCRHLERVDVPLASAHGGNLELPEVPNLRSLTVHSSDHRPVTLGSPIPSPLRVLGGDKLANSLPNLEELCLMDEGITHEPFEVKNLSRLRRYELWNLNFSQIPEWPKTVEHLTLSIDLEAILNPGEGVGNFEGMKDLKSATFNYNNFITIDMLSALLTDSKETLRSLEIAWSQLDFEDLRSPMTAGLLENITHLNIAGVYSIDDEAIPVIIDTMPNLKVLDLSSTNISQFSLKLLTDTDKLKLEKLFVWETNIRLRQDVIEYASSRGVQIASQQIRKEDRKNRSVRFADL